MFGCNLTVLSPPPAWFDGADKICNAGWKETAIEGIAMQCPMPGSSKSGLTVRIPDPLERATMDAENTAPARK